MSWEPWAESLEVIGAHYKCIYGQDGTPWCAKNMACQPCEVANLVDVISHQKQEVFGTGVTLNGEKWLPLRLEKDVLVMKGKGDCKEKMVTVGLSKKALVVGGTKDNSVSSGNVRVAVEHIKTQLESAGY